MKHNHDIDGKLREHCDACAFIRARTTPTRMRAEREVDNDLGQIAKTAMKAKP